MSNIFFNVKEAREFLLKNGVVYTIRKKRSTGKANAVVGSYSKNKVIAKVDITQVTTKSVVDTHGEFDSTLSFYVKKSGFKTLSNWLKAVKKFKPKENMFLYKVTIVKNNKIGVESKARCSACDTEVTDWAEHIKTPTHIRNVKRQRQKESTFFNEDCPLCDIPYREPLLFENELIYLVPTKNKKGHTVRIMASLKRHSKIPTFEERSFAYASVINYMSKYTKKFFLAAPKKASVPDHWHLIACDNNFSNLDEKKSLFTNPYIELPLSQQKILIGIPAHNEEKTIQKIIKESKKHGDVIVVDDGSTDKTREIALKENVIVKVHSENLGYGSSIKDIFEYANKNKYNILITLDADGQHNPSEIPNFLYELETSDIVLGNRFLNKDSTPKYRKFGIKAISKLSGTCDAQCGFRAYNKKAISIIGNLCEKGMGVSVEILKLAQFNSLKISETPCTIQYDSESHSQNPVTHGFEIISALFLTTLWTKPSKVLVPIGLFSFLVTVISTIQTINLYVQFNVIVLSWALFSIGSAIFTLLIFNTLMTILVQKSYRVYER